MRHSRSMFALLSCLAAPPLAAAAPLAASNPAALGLIQQSPVADSTARQPDTTAKRLDTVRIRARRRPGYRTAGAIAVAKLAGPLRDVPQSVTVVTHDLISDLAMTNMADVARYVPGITMGQGEGNRDQPTIRGIGTTADFFVDGVRDDAQYFRDLYNVERVEAMKGGNAMAFGRGGGGGVINRVSKEAEWMRHRSLVLQGGSYGDRRGTADLGGALSGAVALRLNGMYEQSDLYRDGVTLERHGINPTLSIATASRRTRVALGYERFADDRTADRGIPSYQGRPIETDRSTFFGDPAASRSTVGVHSAAATVSHDGAWFSARNRTRYALYDKFYRNVFPGAVNAAGDQVSISAYANDTDRQNLFNQTDLSGLVRTGVVRHAVLVGAELGRQVTDNYRVTGYFAGGATSVSVPVASPTISRPLTFRQGASDADHHVANSVASVYAQDQIEITRHWQAVAGVRYERFGVRFHDNRTNGSLDRVDRMISPRFGLVFKPIAPVSFYGSQSVSYLPSAGDQFTSLTNITQGLAPERFTNREVGAKWDVGDRVALTGAVFRLDRTNTRAPDPAAPTRTVQTGRQRTSGFEVGITGNLTHTLQIAGGYGDQTATITSTTSAATAGATVPLVPRRTLSLWSRWQPVSALGIGVGAAHRSRMYAGIDNRVTLPAFTRLDGGLFLSLHRGIGAQLNVENLLDVRYYPTAHSNNNITPGSGRALRLTLSTDL